MIFQTDFQTDLWDRWRSLFPTTPKTLLLKTFEQISSAYSSPERHYHTLTHLSQVLSVLDQFQPAITVQLAAWFHDIVYDSQAQDNEEQSAEFAEEMLTLLSIDSSAIATVRQLILCTKTHQAYDSDSAILLDADLSILGADPFEYQNYAAAIRREYTWVSDADYRIGRRRVLEKFLSRDRIFLRLDHLEAQARHNLQTEIHNLENI